MSPPRASEDSERTVVGLPEPVIQLFGVTKTYEGGVYALHDVTLRIHKREMVVLTGASGAGKTTLLHTLFAVEKPEEGQVVIAGRNIARLRASSIPYLRRNVGVVFQDFRLLRGWPCWRNVGMALEIRGIPARRVYEQSMEVLAAVGLERVGKTPVGALSGGEQQRVAVARALVAQPAIILADEPTGNLDPAWAHEVLALLQDAAAAGSTVVIATHDPLVVKHAACTQIVRLEAGRVVEMRSGLLGSDPAIDLVASAARPFEAGGLQVA
jgi:cell division transport system ATP-binding protein